MSGAATVRGRVDLAGRLSSADGFLNAANRRAAGQPSGTLALPPLAVLAEQAREAGIPIDRRVRFAAGDEDIAALAGAEPSDHGIALSLTELEAADADRSADTIAADRLIAALAPAGESGVGSNEVEQALRAVIEGVLDDARRLATLTDKDGGGAYREYATDILSAAGHLLALLLDINSLSEATEAFDPVPFDLAEVARSAALWLEAEAQARQVTVDRPEGGFVVAALGEPRRSRQILINLITNAIGHAPPGSCVSIRCFDVDGYGVVTVEDEGPGVPIEESERIFERFVRIGGQTRDGVGLGLYIARRLARSMAGDLVVDTAHRGGARFVLAVPQRATLS
ncbi:sensor histidine kinase [Sphingomonas sp. ID0503]|uniref:ATP-binding protein n=1 Tax=Sphingomonas sp. ID0503 TaxID=3399691 RepID=UPI003AFB4470